MFLTKMCLTFGKNLYLTQKERTTIVFEKKGDWDALVTWRVNRVSLLELSVNVLIMI